MLKRMPWCVAVYVVPGVFKGISSTKVLFVRMFFVVLREVPSKCKAKPKAADSVC